MNLKIDLKAVAMYAWYWAKNIALSLDQLFNVLLWGDPDETLSRRAGRARDKGVGWACWLCSWLDAVDKRHCEKALERVNEEEGYNSVPQLISRWREEHGQRVLRAMRQL